MSAWFALVKKEFRLGLPAFIIAFILYGGMMVGAYGIGYRFGHESAMTLAASITILALHSLFLLFYLFHTLNAERKRLHLWLHTPMSITGLILSKLSTGFVYLLVTFVPFLIISFTLFNQHIVNWLSEESISNILTLSTVGILSSGIFLAVIFLFFWSIFLTFSQRMNDFLSFVVTFILFLLISWGYQELMQTSVMETLTNWGQIQLKDVVVGMEFSFMQSEMDGEFMQENHIFYIGHWVRDLIVAVLAFFAACWVIDKKVEV